MSEIKTVSEKNLEKMLSRDEGGMHWLIGIESMGGNAGSWKGYSNVATNFLLNGETGEIFAFGNYQDFSEENHKTYSHGILVIAVNRRDEEKGYFIHKTIFDDPVSKEVERKLKFDVTYYNAFYGFEPEE